MQERVSDYIANFLAGKGINQVFTVVGGGAMHLNDSFGHHPQMHCLYNHHEQASAMAAEAYARVTGKPAIVCVTSGPGAINALNGVIGAYQDSIPMIVLSGQTKSTLTVKYSGLNLRTLGNQEFDIVSTLSHAAKYAEMIMDPSKIRICLEKAYYLATHGREGPCWLDIPVDIQGMYINVEKLSSWKLIDAITEDENWRQSITEIVTRIKQAKRPVLYAGNGIRLSGGVDVFQRLIQTLQIPVVTCWDSIDLIPTEHPLYCGRGGLMGDRAGNFAVQNSDFLLCIGTRLNIYQVGYDVNTWARAAYTVVVDVDPEELKKKTIRVDLPICADARNFIEALQEGIVAEAHLYKDEEMRETWITQCQKWKREYPVVIAKQRKETGNVNVYAFIDALSRLAGEGDITVVSNGSASVVGSQTYYIKPNTRFLMNCGISSMGYGLPASIGACIANNKKPVICIEGDGSIMMNLQELQTAVTNKLPVKIFIINNNGYHQIRQTQNNVFHDGLVGVGPESHDLGFPDFEKVAFAFGIPYYPIKTNAELQTVISQVLQTNQIILCEVFVTETQKFEPKSATKKLPDGQLVSPPLEDMAPFLSKEELKKNMYIPLIEEK